MSDKLTPEEQEMLERFRAEGAAKAKGQERFRARVLEMVKEHETCEKMKRLVRMAVRSSTGTREEVSAIAAGVNEVDRRNAAHDVLAAAFAEDFPGWQQDSSLRSMVDAVELKSIEATHPETFGALVKQHKGSVSSAHSAWRRGRRE